MSIVIDTIVTRTFTAKALDAEVGRRKNNRKRRAAGEPAVPAKSFVLPALTKAQMAEIKNGAIVAVKFNSGRVETVALKENA